MEQVPFSRIMIVQMEVGPFSQGMMLPEAFRFVILDVYTSSYIQFQCSFVLKLNQVLTLIILPLSEMLPRTRTRVARTEVHEASDTESD